METNHVMSNGATVSERSAAIGDGFEKAKNQIVNGVKSELSRLGDAGEKLEERGEKAVRRVESLVREHPIVSIAVAAGLSALAVGAAVRFATRTEH